jgi:acyl-coenzyme A thioesterase PaaI-like protein
MRLMEQGWDERAAGSPFGELIGPNWEKEENGVTRYGFTVERKHLNRSDGLHGGMISAFLDMALARTIARATKQPRIATIRLGVDFVDVARVGEFVEVRAEIIRSTRSLVFIRGTLLCAERVIATADGLWKIRGEHGTIGKGGQP